MVWWIVALLVALLILGAAPPYLYVVCKFAGAGWLAGMRAYINHRGKREK